MSSSSSRGVVARVLALLLTVLLAVAGLSLPALADEDPGAAPAIETTEAADDPAADAGGTETAPTPGTAEPDAAEATVPDASLGNAAFSAFAAPEESSIAATPTVVVSKTTGLVAGEVITVTGTGFVADAPATNATRPPIAGHFGGVYVAFGKFAQNWKPSAGVTSSQRPTASGQVTWLVDAADTGVTGGTAIGADGSFSVDLTVTPVIANAIADGNFGVYTYPGGGASYPAFETYTPVAFAPTVVVSKTTGLVAGDVVTVTGAGYAPSSDTNATRPPIAGHFGGVYVAFGKFAQNWKPSAGVTSAQRPTASGQVTWFVDAADTGVTGGTAINADGSFTTTLTVTPVVANAIAAGNFGVYTYPGGGASVARFESYTPMTFAPTVVVSKTTGLVEGEIVTVSGAGYAPSTDTNATRPPIAGRFGGVYVAFGKFAQNWKPSAGATSSQRPTASGQVTWFVDAADTAVTGGTAINADGSFTTTLTVTSTVANAIADGNFGVYTYPGGGAAVPRFETYTPMAFQAVTPTPTPTTAPAAQTAGSLVWGVKASWRSYITGIAAGSISVAGGASGAGSGYSFPQSSSSLDPAGLGSAAYRGSVTFRGHDGALDVRLADPVVRLTSSTSGVLSVQTYGGRVDLATLALSAGSRQVDGTGAIVYSAVPATLTASGATAFGGQYAAGTALDPLGFTIGSTNTSAGASRVVAAAVAPTTANTPDPTPPATEGVTTEDTGFTEGATATFTADGFRPNETGILAVIYSEPTVLADDLTADAAGAVSWTGNLPVGLTGEHTFTFQGSVDRGLVIRIAAAEQVGCLVDGAVLDWGFKESFRAYIDGSIAHGEWTTADGATYETPLFSWATGTGGYDAGTGEADLAFPGSVRFTGHGGVLDTTIANPRVVIDGDRAVLLLDVTGTTQSGEPVAQTGVEFAELDLAAAEQGGGGDLVAFTGIPATLTAAGAAAFGTYPEGEALDPVDLSITLDPACLEPVAAVAEPQAEVATENASAASPLPWIIGALVLLLLVAAVVVILVRRRRTA